jgi:predicted O-methyltransferase YrrM
VIDLGSGVGRLALWAAATSAWRRVVGVEFLPALAAAAQSKLAEARAHYPALMRTADVQLVEGSWDDPLEAFAQVDVAFAYTTAIPADEHGILAGLSHALTARLRQGCVVITTDYALDPYATAPRARARTTLRALLARSPSLCFSLSLALSLFLSLARSLARSLALALALSLCASRGLGGRVWLCVRCA